MEAEHQYLVALKLFLVVGPLLGFGALELILLRRDARARSAAPSGAGVGDAVRVRVRG
jgi:hypothetical protein